MRIGIVGNGVVGSATARAFLEWGEVRVYDRVPERSVHPLSDVLACGLTFVCLPTPQREGRLEADVSAIDGFFSAHRGCAANLVLRSTCPVGTTRRLAVQYRLPNLVHSPEFLTARCAFTDAHVPARNIIGDPHVSVDGQVMSDCCTALHDLYSRRFPGIYTHLMRSDESELVKLVVNSFFAVKVAYFNEARSLADRLGLDWDRILGAVLADGRIAHAHTRVPGPDGKSGFGGACLPKDLASFISIIESHGLSAAVTRAVLERNVEDRR